ncbi:MAG: DUF6922 domain-containing protein [Mucilaginibacter sp.]
MNKPILSKRAFWDVNMDTIDYEKHAGYVVEKVIERGKDDDFKNLLKFYGYQRVKELALQANWLSDISINFCCALFKVKPTDFKCYEKKQSNRQHWNF